MSSGQVLIPITRGKKITEEGSVQHPAQIEVKAHGALANHISSYSVLRELRILMEGLIFFFFNVYQSIKEQPSQELYEKASYEDNVMESQIQKNNLEISMAICWNNSRI